jgi:hypothetical protein
MKNDYKVGQELKCKVSCKLIGKNNIIFLPDKEELREYKEFIKGKKYKIYNLTTYGIRIQSEHSPLYSLYPIEIPKIFYIQPILSNKITIL